LSTCELSLVIPAQGTQEELDRLLEDLKRNKPDETWELLIVDDGSVSSLSLEKKHPSNWQIISTNGGEGAARARNLGGQMARGEYIIFLSLFLSIPADYIKRIHNFIVRNKFDYAQHLIEKAPVVSATRFQEFIVNQKNRTKLRSGSVPIKQSLFTAALIRKDIFTQMAGFDGSMQHYGGHEMDLIYRMEKAGYDKRVIVYNIPLQRVKLEDHNSVRKRLIEYGRTGLPALIKKHPEIQDKIIKRSIFWKVMFNIGFTVFVERLIKNSIEKNRQLPRVVYKLYLHLIVRNTWTVH